jgi:hypothetical protein
MVKRIIIYTLFLIVADAFCTVVINLIQRGPYDIIIASIVIRAVCLGILFPIIGSGISLMVDRPETYLPILLTTIVVYFLLPAIVFILKYNNKSIFEVYIELHTQFYLFTLVFLPYLIGSTICFLLFKKVKLF